MLLEPLDDDYRAASEGTSNALTVEHDGERVRIAFPPEAIHVGREQ